MTQTGLTLGYTRIRYEYWLLNYLHYRVDWHLGRLCVANYIDWYSPLLHQTLTICGGPVLFLFGHVFHWCLPSLFSVTLVSLVPLPLGLSLIFLLKSFPSCTINEENCERKGKGENTPDRTGENC